jgi:hypothetical protein
VASRYWVGNDGTWDASSTTHWAATSGGSGGASVPGSADIATFDLHSHGTITLSSPPTIGGLMMTPPLLVTLNSDPLTIAGSVTLNSNVLFNANITLTGTGAQTFTSGGATIAGLTINTITGTYTLQDDLVGASTSALTLTAGTLTANGFNVSYGNFVSTSSSTRVLNMGAGTWTLSGSGTVWSISGSPTINASTSKILISNTSNVIFAGGGKTYNNFEYSPSSGTPSLTVTGNNTFNEFKDVFTGLHTIGFPSGGTQTFATFTVRGSDSSHTITLHSDNSGTTYTLSVASGTVHGFFLLIKDCVATGGASWIASSSIDLGNNSGWQFQSIPSMLLLF